MTGDLAIVSAVQQELIKAVPSFSLASDCDAQPGNPLAMVSEPGSVTGSKTGPIDSGAVGQTLPDLRVHLLDEAANILELQKRLSRQLTPFCMPSKAAQVVLRQF